MKYTKTWGAPTAAAVFLALWLLGQGHRMYGTGFLAWPPALPLLALTLAIGVSARHAYAALLVLFALLGAQILRIVPAPDSHTWPIYIGAAVVLFFAALTGDRWKQAAAVAAAPFFSAAMAFLMLSRSHSSGLGWLPIDNVSRVTMRDYWFLYSSFLLVILAVGWLAGFALRSWEDRRTLSDQRTVAVEDLRAAEVDLIVEQERTRISRDLHDVLAHSLAVIAAQADGSRYLGKDQPQPVLDALENIASAARRALTDAQRVIEGVGDDGSSLPQPRLEDIGELVEQQGNSLQVERTESGVPVDLPEGQQMAVFRIVQESLTNALRHGGTGTRVTVHLDWSGPGLSLQIASYAARRELVAEAATTARTGRGIPGMRERAHLAGGWLTAGPDGDSFRVTAFLPYGLMLNAPGAEIYAAELVGADE
ncbi:MULTISPECIES: histidine kinase [unclassified Arthrobacter]|uniref:sensor histidine kinase n=1 Tax=unclassified Arthrobacter TaxID=235627 RepID=UPI001E5DC5FA|nr:MULTISPECIES: histidine kinase [unclassified Arthrobacter]MCC9144391.1 histidine kinase [Arthrobacter sp. zg-Y919]MDK1275617.1 histidine kinase [Arthrobacter sp. zg.Y919]WIB03014.1 histidine kinase [Arthrobacter sp. zg-Y919]